jgi:7-dehydrocholesterol reductase
MNEPSTPLRVETRLQSWLTGLPVGALSPAPPTRTPADDTMFRLTIAPLALMVFTPVLSIIFWMACARHDGSIMALLQAGPEAWIAGFPAPSVKALGLVLAWTAFQLVLLEFLPGKKLLGPPTPEGEQPEYKLNGIASWVISHAAVLVGWKLGWFNAEAFYHGYGELLITLTIFAFAFCGFLYWKGRTYPTSRDAVYTGNFIFDFFQGPELHPRIFGVNLKQLINCRVSMMAWSVTFVIFALAQYEMTGAVSTSMIASVAILVIYLFKFFWWEGGYFHSIDIILDRFGYYICWGVLVWVPAVYCLVALWLVEHPIEIGTLATVAIIAFGILAIWINYDADAQRQRVRATNGETKVWGKAPKLIHARYTTGDGEQRDSILLVSGWWGVARHFHYVPELALAAAWTIPAGFTHFLPWFYWVFLFILLMDRARRDEKKCAAKYGRYWDEYVKEVRWRVVPFVY